MNLKTTLIVLTIVSVVADTMILPFYPQFFEQEFNLFAPEYVGYYIASCCLTVMVTFPLWAKLARNVNELHLWVYTQIISACFGYASYTADSLWSFWLLSQCMLAFKASYLLIYPFCIRLEEQDKHLNIAGLFSILMHFSAIGGALLGGYVLRLFAPRDLYLVMIFADILQVLVCLYLICRYRFAFRQEQITDQLADRTTGAEEAIADIGAKSWWQSLREKQHILAIGMVFLVLYFGSFLSRPFFTRYWEVLTETNNAVISGFVYSIPAWFALFALWVNHRRKDSGDGSKSIIYALLIGAVGLALHAVESTGAIIIGRCLFGWAIFQAAVRLEVLIFRLSPKQDYASDFSIVHLFQNIGVLMSSFAVGWIVTVSNLSMPFIISALGFLAALVTYLLLFKFVYPKADTEVVEQPEDVDAQSAETLT